MPLQTLTLKLDGITAGDYLTWCRDPDPPALDWALRSISIDADPLGDTITAVLDWNQAPPPSRAAAGVAGLPLSTGVQIDAALTETSPSAPLAIGTRLCLTETDAPPARRADLDAEQRLPGRAGAQGQARAAA